MSTHTEYAKLPEGIKMVYSEKEYQFLPQVLKDSLIEDETTPDWEDEETACE